MLRKRLACLAFLGLTAAAVYADEPPAPKNIRDFFVLAPDAYVDDMTRSEREALVGPKSGRLIALDVKNGYVVLSGDGGAPGVVAALFKKPDGQCLLAIDLEWEIGDRLWVLSYSAGKWEEVTASVIPSYSPKFFYKLPQTGTTIEVSERVTPEGEQEAIDIGKKVYSLAWKNGRFLRVSSR